MFLCNYCCTKEKALLFDSPSYVFIYAVIYVYAGMCVFISCILICAYYSMSVFKSWVNNVLCWYVHMKCVFDSMFLIFILQNHSTSYLLSFLLSDTQASNCPSEMVTHHKTEQTH